MLICPELKKVFILVPRTGSGSLYREIMRVYPRSMLLYRHMEADGCPVGYDRWDRVGFVRHPLWRMWSLYWFLKQSTGMIGTAGGTGDKAHHADSDRKREQVDCDFQTWLLHNDAPFMTAADMTGNGAYWPVLHRNNQLPENKLSQFQYLRPDLGVKIFRFEDLREMMVTWGLSPNFTVNKTDVPFGPPTNKEVMEHMYNFHGWDMAQGCAEV